MAWFTRLVHSWLGPLGSQEAALYPALRLLLLRKSRSPSWRRTENYWFPMIWDVALVLKPVRAWRDEIDSTWTHPASAHECGTLHG
jgi:hypothetical protein